MPADPTAGKPHLTVESFPHYPERLRPDGHARFTFRHGPSSSGSSCEPAIPHPPDIDTTHPGIHERLSR